MPRGAGLDEPRSDPAPAAGRRPLGLFRGTITEAPDCWDEDQETIAAMNEWAEHDPLSTSSAPGGQ